ncbi:ABC1 kinase family protein [Aestuariispira insulae]|uniref:ABC1 family protein n=1 Tax=Aestuariispira insulae TaxID=1461337 RepID=A0A3D9HFA0_9PROT|nr:AarF/ABC1/UbiB kinase family protein [Aestuariispira insulae]RED48150.1 ABC1 family protein [Aestuariispira insulae]
MAGGRIVTGKLARSASMGLAATRIGLKQLDRKGRGSSAEQQLDHEREIGKILFGALNQLKGTALKASQILSMEVDFLPRGVREELSRGCYQATPLNAALVHRAFRREFGCGPEDLFEHFDPQAFSAASLGQVHFARGKGGRKLAVKVQYPGIAASIRSDVKMISNLLAVLSNASDLIPDRKVTGIVMDEIERQLEREVSYQLEADNTDWFRDVLRLPGFSLPEVDRDRSSDRILTLGYLEGEHLEDWLAGNPDQAARDHYGQMIFDFFLHSVFELGCLHADPHPGNFLFMDAGRLGLIDFGCIKQMPRDFAEGMADFYNCFIAHQLDPQPEALLAAYQRLGLVEEGLGLEEYSARLQPNLAPLQRWIIEPFLTSVFDFSQKEPMPHLEGADARAAMPYLKGMPRNILYFDRTFHGVIHMLRRIGARVRTQNSWIGPDMARVLT